MAAQYSGVRESIPGRVNDLGDSSVNIEDKFKKGCLKRADRSFAQGLQCQQINSMAALMSLEDSDNMLSLQFAQTWILLQNGDK